MDPILIAAAHALSSQPDSTDPEAFMRQYTAGKYGADDAERYLGGINTNINPRNIGRSVAMGATANFAPDLMDTSPDAVSGSIPGPVGQLGGAMLKLFGAKPGAGTDMRTKANMYAQAHPAASALGNMGGMIGTAAALPETELPAAVAGASLKVRSALALLKSMGIGYGAGTASVAGAQDPESRDWGAAATSPTALVSGLAAPIVPAVMGATNYLSSPVAQGAMRVSQALARSGGAAGIEPTLQAASKAGLGDQFMLGDASDAFRSLQKSAAAASPDANTAIGAAVGQRQAAMPARLETALRENLPDLGGDIMPSASARLEDLQSALKLWRKGPNGYDAIQDRLVPNTTLPSAATSAELSPAGQAFLNFFSKKGTEDLPRTARVLLQDPTSMQGPLGKGAQDYLDYQAAQANNGGAAPSVTAGLDNPLVAGIVKKAEQAGLARGVPVGTATLQKLIAIKSQIGDAAAKEMTSTGGNSDAGNALFKIKNDLDQHLQQNNSDYLRVSADYRGQKGQATGVQEGVDAINSGDTGALQRLMARSNPAKQQEIRTGMAATLIENMHNQGPNGSVARSLLDASQPDLPGTSTPAMQDKLRVIFGDDNTYQNFMAKAAVEHTMSKAAGTYKPSSDYRTDAQTEPSQLVLNALQHSYGSINSAMPRAIMIRGAARAARLNMGQAAASNIGDATTTQGIGNIRAFLARQAMRKPLVGPVTTKLLPAAIGAGAAGLLGRPDQP